MLKVLNKGKTEELSVAGIFDEFSYKVFKPDCNLIYLNPLNYKHILLARKVHLLFVESVWEGIDKKWKGIYGGWDTDKIACLKCIVKYCRVKHIPTVFWNKEDPIHFKEFINIARLFDFVFTTDESCIEKYVKLLGHERVYVLPFAAQPAIHNPLGKDDERLGTIAFAGSWYRYHMNRIRDMDIILKPAFKYGISIYDRNYFRKSISFRYPKEYKRYIKGGLPYNEIIKTYKKYDIFLNVNSVQNSPTMFSRRVFELLACGTNVISGYAAGIENLFSDVIPLCKTPKETEYFLNKLLNDREFRDRLSVLGQREIFKHHTSRHRLTYILSMTGLKYTDHDLSGVSIITWIDNQMDLNLILENYWRQTYNKKEIIIIMNKSTETIDNIRSENNIKVLLSDEYNSMKECFKSAVNSESSYKYLSFFNPRSFYGPEFIGDLMNALQYSGADISGKHTYYVHAKDSKNLYVACPGNEYRFSSLINPNAMVMNKSILDRVILNCSSDGIIRKIQFEDSLKIYSADRFNYAFEPGSMAEIISCPLNSCLSKDDIIKVKSSADYKTIVTV